MKNKKKLFIGIIILLIFIFSMTYCLSIKYLGNNKEPKDNSVVVSQVDKDNQLKDNMKIYLVSGEKKEKELTLAELKKQLNLEDNLTTAELSKELKDKGYVLEVDSNGTIAYKKDISGTVKPNKYYIGECWP